MNKKNFKIAEVDSEPKVPTDLRKAFAAIPSVEAVWKNLTPIARRDFIYWIDSAKQPETRIRRIEKTCAILPKGKRRPCCYSLVPMNLYKSLGANPKAKAQWKELAPIERREFIYWIDSAKDLTENKQRVEKACAMLATGKQRPE